MGFVDIVVMFVRRVIFGLFVQDYSICFYSTTGPRHHHVRGRNSQRNNELAKKCSGGAGGVGLPTAPTGVHAALATWHGQCVAAQYQWSIGPANGRRFEWYAC